MPSRVQGEFELFATPASDITREFLGWNRPLLSLATDFLTRDWSAGTLDLSQLAVVVPTRNAARRLREALALRASAHDAAVLPPRLFNPDDLLIPQAPAAPVASRAESLLAWTHTLLRLDPRTLRHLLPVDPPEHNFFWALRTALDLTKIQSLLGEASRNAAYAAKALGANDLEPERWAEFARIERDTYRFLRDHNRTPASVARAEAIEHAALPPERKSLILLGLPDISHAFERFVESVSARIPVQVAIHAPAEQSAGFDRFGRPTSAWQGRPIPIDVDAIHQGATPHAQAQRVCERIAPHGKPHDFDTVGVPDPEVIPP